MTAVAGIAGLAVLAAEPRSGGSVLGLLVPLAVVGVLGLVVARSLRRQRDYERRLSEHPEGPFGGVRPAEPEEDGEGPGDHPDDPTP